MAQPAAVLPLLLAALALPGCTDACLPLLELRPCTDEGACGRRAQDPELAWDEAWAQAWPDVDRLLRRVPSGEHGHADWDRATAERWWRAVGVDPEAPQKQVFIRHEGALHRVRVLTC